MFRATPSRRVQVGVGVALTIGVWAPLVERAQAGNRVVGGVVMSGVDLSNSNPDKLAQRLSPLVAEIESRPLTITLGEQTLQIDPKTVGVKVDLEATVRRAREAGFSKNPIEAAGGVLTRRIEADHIVPVVRYDDDAVQRLLDSWERSDAVTLREGDLRIVGTTVEVSPAIPGTGFDRGRALEALTRGFEDPRIRTVAVPIQKRKPNRDQAALEAAANRARALLANTYVVTIGDRKLTITPDDLGPSLRTKNRTGSLEVNIDERILRARLKEPLSKLEREAVNATWKFERNEPALVAARSGAAVPMDEVIELIHKGDPQIAVELETVEPERDTEWAKRMDIRDLVAEYTTPFPAGEDRVTNIRVAAKTLNGTLVEPGETFSLNALLGERTLEKGYVLAYSIAADLTFEDTVGGGVSQVAATLYNATYAAGMEDIEHTAHSIYISRYPLGREATLAWPSTDLKFKNTLESGALIGTTVGDDYITVRVFGNANGQRVVTTEPIQLREIEVTTNRYCKVNDDMSSGARRRISGTPGYEVEYSRQIVNSSGESRTERRNARYAMRPNRCEVGPDTPTENPDVVKPEPAASP